MFACYLGFQIIGGDGDRVVLDDSDLVSICNKLKLVSIHEEDKSRQQESTSSTGSVAQDNANFMISDEELARRLQVALEILISLCRALCFFFS